MTKSTLTLEHRKALIKVKAEMIESIPGPRSEDMTFIEYLKSVTWGFDAVLYDEDEEYRQEQHRCYYDNYITRLEENKAFNELLDEIYSVLS